ncbi:hypothetical protein BaRGS_00005305, partial [Batillaria attramentaria]
ESEAWIDPPIRFRWRRVAGKRYARAICTLPSIATLIDFFPLVLLGGRFGDPEESVGL